MSDRINVLHIGCGDIVYRKSGLIGRINEKSDCLVNKTVRLDDGTKVKIEAYHTGAFPYRESNEQERLVKEIKTRLQRPYDVLGFCKYCYAANEHLQEVYGKPIVLLSEIFPLDIPNGIDYNASLSIPLETIVEINRRKN